MTTAKEPHKPIWEVAEELTAKLPQTVLDKLPTDGAENHDRYLYRQYQNRDRHFSQERFSGLFVK